MFRYSHSRRTSRITQLLLDSLGSDYYADIIHAYVYLLSTFNTLCLSVYFVWDRVTYSDQLNLEPIDQLNPWPIYQSADILQRRQNSNDRQLFRLTLQLFRPDHSYYTLTSTQSSMQELVGTNAHNRYHFWVPVIFGSKVQGSFLYGLCYEYKCDSCVN